MSSSRPPQFLLLAVLLGGLALGCRFDGSGVGITAARDQRGLEPASSTPRLQEDSAPDAGGADSARADGPGPDQPRADAPRLTCAEIFGAVQDYFLCVETEDSCQFFVTTGGISCDALCGRFGRVCLSSSNANPAVNRCAPSSGGGCATGFGDQMCTCSR